MSVALTFDDGPHFRWTPHVLDALDGLGVKGTFFVLGERLASDGEIAQQAAERGHVIAPHGNTHYSHSNLQTEEAIRHEIDTVLARIEDLGITPARLWRPPAGHIQPEITRKVAEDLDLTVLLWTVTTEDFVGKTADQMIREITDGTEERKELEPDGVVLFHDAPCHFKDWDAPGEPHCQAVIEAIPRVVALALERGYEIAPLQTAEDAKSRELKDRPFFLPFEDA